jgi:HEAT repeat protein
MISDPVDALSFARDVIAETLGERRGHRRGLHPSVSDKVHVVAFDQDIAPIGGDPRVGWLTYDRHSWLRRVRRAKMSITLAVLGTVLTSEPARKAATSAAAKASSVLVGQVGQHFQSAQAKKELAEAFAAGLALAAYEARTRRDPNGENREDVWWKRLHKRAFTIIKLKQKLANDNPQTQWWDRHGKAIFAPFEDQQLATAVSKCAIGTPDAYEIRQQLTTAITTHRRHRFKQTRSYASLADFGNKHDIDADFFCEILAACVIDAIIAAGAQPGSRITPQALLAQLSKLTPQLRVLPLGPLQVREQVAKWCVRESDRQHHNIDRLAYLKGRDDPANINIRANVSIGLRRKTQPTDNPYLPAAARLTANEDLTTYDNVVNNHRQVIVLGDPGAGKSWALQMHAIRLAQDAAARLDNNDVHPNDVDLPIAVRCDALADHRGGLAEAAVAELADLDSAMTLGLRQWLETRCRSGKVTFLLDAFDETPAEQRYTVSEMIDRQPNQDAKIIVTCRIANYSTGILNSGQLCEVELRPFDHPEDYVSALDLPAERKNELIQLLRTPALGSMAKIPLLLALLCHLASDPTEDLPRTPAVIYQRIFHRFLSSEQSPEKNFQGAALPADPIQRANTLLGILRPLAYRIATSEDGWLDLIPATTLDSHFEAIEPSSGMKPADASAVLTNAGVLVREGDVRGGRNPPYLFVHRTFAEYLVADYLAMPGKPVDECLTSRLHLEPDWYQTWLLLTSLAPKAILPKLVNRPQDPLHVALSTAAAAIFQLDPNTRAEPEVSRSVDDLIGKCLRLINPPADPAVRTVAIDALGLIGGANAIDSLRGLLTGSDGEAAAFALAGSPDPAGPATLRGFLTDHAIGGGDAEQPVTGEDFLHFGQRYLVRHRVAQILSLLGDAESIQFLCNIVADPHSDPETRNIVIPILVRGHGNDPAVIKALGAVMNANDADLDIRLRAASELRYCGPCAIEPLHTLVNQDGDVPPELRENAIRAIAAIGGPEAHETLQQLHSDTDAEITAATAAAESYSEPAPAIQNDPTDSSDAPPDPPPDEPPDPAESPSSSTEWLEDEMAVEKLQIQDPDILTRGVAGIKLANCGDMAGTAVLCEVLDHADFVFGTEVARALGRLGRLAGQQATEALIRALDTPKAHVTFLHEVVKALANVDNSALTNWVITRNKEGLNPNQIGPIYHHFRNKSCPPSLRPQLLSALAEVTTRAERGESIS